MIGVMNLWQIPGSIFAPAIANSIIQLAGTWRSVFYLLTAVSGLSMVLYFFFYNPPTFHEKHGMTHKKLEFIKNFDYLGTCLYAIAIVFFLLGVSWGGSKYPWNSAHVISFMVIGGTSFVAFILYETLAKPTEPLIPLELWKNRHFLVSSVLCGIGAGIFYAGASE
jgi:MFS family permease